MRNPHVPVGVLLLYLLFDTNALARVLRGVMFLRLQDRAL